MILAGEVMGQGSDKLCREIILGIIFIYIYMLRFILSTVLPHFEYINICINRSNGLIEN